jgi:septal ring factor EnvC (AmiA/AmiB activator)
MGVIMMEPIDPAIAELEMKNLDVHVTASHMRHKNLEQGIARIEKSVEKLASETKENFSELKKVIVWTASTLFATMLIALLSSVFKVL